MSNRLKAIDLVFIMLGGIGIYAHSGSFWLAWGVTCFALALYPAHVGSS